MSYIDDIQEIEEIEEIFFNLEEYQINRDMPIDNETSKKEKRNSLGLTEKEAEIVSIILFGGIFIILLTSILIGYMMYYFALPY